MDFKNLEILLADGVKSFDMYHVPNRNRTKSKLRRSDNISDGLHETTLSTVQELFPTPQTIKSHGRLLLCWQKPQMP